MRKLIIGAAILALVAAAASAQSIVVVKPAAGQTVLKQETCHILWVKNGTMPATVRISLRDPATLAEIMLIADNVPNSGSYDWVVPAGITDGTYRIRVKVKNSTIQADSGAFPLHGAPAPGPAIIQAPLRTSQVPPAMIGLPALSISNAGLVVYDDSFRITFAYKNSGIGNLPKSSDMPVKPTFRVLVDGQVLNQGTLVIPAFPAPPGWEQPSFYGGEIKLQASSTEWDEKWTIGNTLAIYINENKVNGMASDMKTYNLRQLALGYTFDAYITGATYDWKTEMLTAYIHIDGEFGASTKFRLYNTGTSNPIFIDKGMGGFLDDYDLVPGKHYYLMTHKIHMSYMDSVQQIEGWIGALVLRPGSELWDPHDVYHPNNAQHFTFHR